MHQIVFKISKPAAEKTSAANRKYFVQRCLVRLLDRDGNPEEVDRITEIIVDGPMQPGEYTIDPRSFGVGQYDKFELRRLVLAPVNSQNGGAPGAPAKK